VKSTLRSRSLPTSLCSPNSSNVISKNNMKKINFIPILLTLVSLSSIFGKENKKDENAYYIKLYSEYVKMISENVSKKEDIDKLSKKFFKDRKETVIKININRIDKNKKLQLLYHWESDRKGNDGWNLNMFALINGFNKLPHVCRQKWGNMNVVTIQTNMKDKIIDKNLVVKIGLKDKNL